MKKYLGYLVVIIVLAAGAAALCKDIMTRYKFSRQSHVRTTSIWISSREEVDRAFRDIIAQHKEELLRGEKHSKLIQGDKSLKEIALTFDDGPHPGFTRELLKILRDNDVKATFFLVGKKARKYPQLVLEEIKEGHEIGNHTYDHVNLTKVSLRAAATQIKACGKVLQSITGQAPHLFRPPGGDYNSQIIGIADRLGYVTVLWTANAGDCSRIGKEGILFRLFSRSPNGGVFLMHDGIDDTMAILPQVIAKYKREGYRFVTVDQLIADSRVAEAMAKIRPNYASMAYKYVLDILPKVEPSATFLRKKKK